MIYKPLSAFVEPMEVVAQGWTHPVTVGPGYLGHAYLGISTPR